METLFFAGFVGLREHDYHNRVGGGVGREHAVEVVEVGVLGALGGDVVPVTEGDGGGVDVVVYAVFDLEFDAVGGEGFDVGVAVPRDDRVTG